MRDVIRGRVRALVLVALGLGVLGRPVPARAEGPAGATEGTPVVGSPEAVAGAQAHFARGRDLYQAGAYREAIVELDAARALDPKAKALVFNLAVVHEKLGQIDEALRYARLYAEMDLEAAERTRAETYIKRLEGAKAEFLALHPLPGPTVTPLPPEAPRRGRVDVATIVAASVAVGALGGGIALGAKALGDQPSGFVTGSHGATLASEQSLQDKAHTEATAADVCFGVAAGAAVAAAVLYFARYRDVASRQAPAPERNVPAAPRPAAAVTALSNLLLAPMVSSSSAGLAVGARF